MRRSLREACVVALFLAFAACDQQGCGGCAGCGVEQIPGGFPLENRVPNSGQVRLTTHGIDFIEANLSQIVSQFLPDGLTFQIPHSTMDLQLAMAEVCPSNDCWVDITLTDATLDPRAPNVLAVSLRMILQTRGLSVSVSTGVICSCEIDGWNIECDDHLECDIDVDTQNVAPQDLEVTVDIVFTTDPHTGYTEIEVESPDVGDDLAGGDISISQGNDCFLSVACDLLDIEFLKDLLVPLLVDQLGSQLAGPIEEQLCRQCQDVGACPNGNSVASSCNGGTCEYDDDGTCVPLLLGMEGRADLGTLLQSITPGLTGRMQFTFASGGDGVADTGLNLAFMGGLDSLEHNRCVPVRQPPVMPDIPTASGIRANETPGGRESMVNIGISEDYLNWASFGVFDSGMLCIGAGPRLSQQLSTGLFSLVFPSLADVAFPAEKAAVALQLRPQQPPFIDIGAGTEDDPILGIFLDDLQMDFYAFVEDRYVRFMTVQVDMGLGINLQLGPDGLEPIINDPSIANVIVTNSEMMQEDPEDIAAVFGDLVGIALGTFLGSMNPIALPDLMGFQLDVPEDGITRVTELDSDFLAIFANLSFAAQEASLPIETDTAVALDGVDVDPRAFDLVAGWQDLLPVAHLSFEANVPDGNDAEWSYRVDEGTWSRWSAERRVDVRSKSFLLQGDHRIEVRSRVAGNGRSGDRTPAVVDFTIDTRAPQVELAVDGDTVVADAADVVDEPEVLAYSFRREGGTWSAWSSTPRFARAGKDAVEVRVKDRAGNVAAASIDGAGIIRGGPSTTAESACQCNLARGSSQDTGAPLAMVVTALLGLALVRRRRTARRGARSWWKALVLFPFALLAGGCDCAGGTHHGNPDPDAGPACAEECSATAACCETSGECVEQPDYGCEPGYECRAEGAFDEESCTWADDCECVPMPPIEQGFIGSYTDFAMAGDGTIWVSGYSEGVPRRDPYGDLVVGTWETDHVEWVVVDGLPTDGEISGDPNGWRGGTADPGDDVGRYTSLALGPDDSPRVAYYDVTNGDLKIALNDDGTWVTDVIDGNGDAGRYASMVSMPDLHPLVAYWATVPDPDVPGRFVGRAMIAEADDAYPQSWTLSVLHEVPVPCRPWYCNDGEECAEDGHCFTPGECGADCGDGMECDAGTCVPVLPSEWIEDWPEGTGLFASVALDPAGNPGVAFYDSTNGDLYRASSNGAAWSIELLDGFDGVNDTGDVGFSSTLAIDDGGTWHVAYVNGWSEALLYRNLDAGGAVETADDGYRDDGLHLVGEDAQIAVAADGTVSIVYQDATAGTLERATRDPSGEWSREILDDAGTTGFFAKQFGGNHVGCYYRDYQADPPEAGVRVF